MPYAVGNWNMSRRVAIARNDRGIKTRATGLVGVKSPRLLAGLLASAAWCSPLAADPVAQLQVRVHRVLPHDAQAFTQGLAWRDGKLYESTGRRGRSELRRLDPVTGQVERRQPIPVFFFGEGLAWAGQRLAMLTWQAERVLFFNIEDFQQVATIRYRGEGWGLCHDGDRFVMSDGSAVLAFRDTATFARRGAVRVTLNGAPLARLNELECARGLVFANVFGEDFLVAIDPASGRVTRRVDASGLLDEEEARAADVLNGIAYDPERARFYLTGKLWPRMFEVTFVPE